jgi:hypothetical protein
MHKLKLIYMLYVCMYVRSIAHNQVFYNTKVDGEDNGPQRDGALRQPGRSSERVVSVR